MPTAQHWRLIANSSNGGSFTELTEVAFLDATGSDLSTGGTASASSEFSGTYSAAKAFDKSNATNWSSTSSSFPNHIQYDHLAPVSVEGVRITLTNSGNAPVSLGGLRVRYSTDGTTWSDELFLKVEVGGYAPVAGATFDFGFYTQAQLETGRPDGFLFADSPVPSGTSLIFLSDGVRSYRDFEFGGSGRIAGTVKEDGTPDVPVKRRVRLHREQDGLLVREVWSHPTTGAYSFDYIDTTKRYTVITYDYEHDYRAVIADNITPEAMP